MLWNRIIQNLDRPWLVVLNIDILLVLRGHLCVCSCTFSNLILISCDRRASYNRLATHCRDSQLTGTENPIWLLRYRHVQKWELIKLVPWDAAAKKTTSCMRHLNRVTETFHDTYNLNFILPRSKSKTAFLLNRAKIQFFVYFGQQLKQVITNGHTKIWGPQIPSGHCTGQRGDP